MKSRGKALIAIVSIVVLLLAALFASQVVRDLPSSDSPLDGASATNDPASRHTANPPAGETSKAGAAIASNMSANEPALPATNSQLESSGESKSPAMNATPPAESLDDPKPDPRRSRVAAECWGLRGAASRDYVVTLDREVRTSGEASALITSRRGSGSGSYATIFQTAAAEPVRGKRVEFSLDLRTRGATEGANVLLRAEDAYGNTVAFDNMVTSYVGDQRPYKVGNLGVKGDTEWSTQRVVVDIPDEARVITYGLSLFGPGKAWIDNARIEVVPDDIATTAPDIRQSPMPLGGMPIDPASLTRSPRNLEFDLEAQPGAKPCN